MARCWTLTDDVVDVWLVRLPPAAPPPALLAMLSPAELAAAGRFRHRPSHDSYVVTRGVLRQLLARYLGEAPAAVEITSQERGKPVVRGPLRFNVSHSGEFALLGFARDCDVGVDIEAVRAAPDWLAIARRFFAADEADALAATADAQRETAFFRCWTRKEAFVKATGLGLSAPLDSFSVSLDATAPRFVRLPPTEDNWSLHDIAVGRRYAAALVHRGEARSLRLHRLDDPLALCATA
ncbi:4'-phosphopantetheinyl transferase family protein [Sphingomonas qomolangmaensis]|uniref:4'-phosphopantetheinyl transferase superfamily protein n=1 Tax=Sphingomonas qomolangmaensis TaxID=2918765 RepID=A0ABY5L5R4_9SPHN|nr:4'-phosphopantetheinyl transferase superfamily protein [Sphingomonas qomolangmaensis]UUL82299.1 4'-phosphopantetheinyl transferase superfamily protein [Sphingomonas qomolangmaensis]